MAFKTIADPPHPIHKNGWHAYDAQGRLLRLSHGITVCPFKWHGGSWDCVVVEGNAMYPRGGYNICVPDEDLLAADELTARPAPVGRGEHVVMHALSIIENALDGQDFIFDVDSPANRPHAVGFSDMHDRVFWIEITPG